MRFQYEGLSVRRPPRYVSVQTAAVSVQANASLACRMILTHFQERDGVTAVGGYSMTAQTAIWAQCRAAQLLSHRNLLHINRGHRHSWQAAVRSPGGGAAL